MKYKRNESNKKSTMNKDNKQSENSENPADEMQSNLYLILDFSAVNYIDTTGVKTILQLIQDLKDKNVFIYICQAQGKLKKNKD